MKSYDIALIPGDGTGPEVVAEGVKVLNAACAKHGIKLNYQSFDFGGERNLRCRAVDGVHRLLHSSTQHYRATRAELVAGDGHWQRLEEEALAPVLPCSHSAGIRESVVGQWPVRLRRAGMAGP